MVGNNGYRLSYLVFKITLCRKQNLNSFYLSLLCLYLSASRNKYHPSIHPSVLLSLSFSLSLPRPPTVWEGKKLFPLLSYNLFIEACELN